jgi:NADPH-dependent 2,4-dienoyl-CoA reductase/sulfur reductase-like enzyme
VSGLVVVGSGPAALAAAQAYRESDGDGPVTMITEDVHPPYARPPLTKDYLRGADELDDLWLRDDSWFEDNLVTLTTGTRVTGIDPEARRVSTSGAQEVGYADLVLATGSRPQPLPVPGGDHPDLVYVRDLASGRRLRQIAEQPSGRVVVIGSGFIGCEAAASFATQGVETVLVTDEDIPHTRRLGAEAGKRIADWLRTDGVDLRTGSALAMIERTGHRWALRLDDDTMIDAAHVVCAGGARPRLELAETAGLALANGGVVADSLLRTSVAHIRVAGDIAYAWNVAAGRPLRVEHWGDAETQGEIAGAGAAGRQLQWASAPGFWSTIGDRTLKYSSWGDGFDDCEVRGDDRSWTVWYRQGTQLAGVLSYRDDDAYELGQGLLAERVPYAQAIDEVDR